MDKKAIALLILKEVKDYKNIKIRKRQQEYFKPYKKQNKPWADIAIDYSVDFIEVLESLLNNYKKSCLDTIKNSRKLFKKNYRILKAKDYRTDEYLDERYNHVVVPDIKDKLLELNNSFKESLKEAYEKYITHGLVSDAAGLIYKGLEMDFDFNKFDETTRDYLRDKKIKWANKVAETTERGIKNQLVNGYEQGLSTYDVADSIDSSTGFGFRRSEAIARTEIISSCNYADYKAFLENPNVIGLKWSSSGDDRVRVTHKAADGQIRKKIKKGNHYELEKPFKVGSSELKYPGDNSLGAAAKEVINCRCTLYPVFRGESLESNTIYDEPDAGTEQWILRQSDLFQNDYAGGQAKAALMKKGFIKLKDINKSWDTIKSECLKKAENNFNKVQFQEPFKSLSNDTKNIVLQSILNVLGRGLNKDKEFLQALNINNGKKIFKDIEAADDKKSRIETNDTEGKIIDNQPDNSVILIHNHPDGITLSPNDMITFLKHKSIKCVIAVGHNSNIYAIWIDKRNDYNISSEKWNLIASSLTKAIEYKTKKKLVFARDPKSRLEARDIYENFMKDLYLKYNINYLKVD